MGSPKISTLNYVKKIVGKGVSSSNLYQFDIQTAPEMLRFMEANDALGKGSFKDKQYSLNLMCDEIQIPGSSFNTFDVRAPKKGLTSKLATARLYNELDVSFICDLDSTPISFFKMWQDMIIGIQPMSEMEAPQKLYDFGSKYFSDEHLAYAQRYYDEYACDITITKLEKFGGEKEPVKEKLGSPPAPTGESWMLNKQEYTHPFKVKLAKAYPYSFSTVPYSAGPAQAVKCQVAFFYEYQQFAFKPLAKKQN